VEKVADLGPFLDGWRAGGRHARQNFLERLDRPHANPAAAGQYDLLELLDFCPDTSFEEMSAAARLDLLRMDQAVASMAFGCAQGAIRRGDYGAAAQLLLTARGCKVAGSLAVFRDRRWQFEPVDVATTREYSRLRASALHSQFVSNLASLTGARTIGNGVAMLLAMLAAFLTLRTAEFPYLMLSCAKRDRLKLSAYFTLELCLLLVCAWNAPDWDFWFGDWRAVVPPWFIWLLSTIMAVAYGVLLSRLAGVHGRRAAGFSPPTLSPPAARLWSGWWRRRL
jgi:hypothetical protein